MSAPPAIELCAVSGASSDGACLREVSAAFRAGCLHILRGTEGCGKAALFRFAGLLEEPPAGEVRLHGEAAHGLTEEARTELRAQRFGFVFAAPFLLGSFSVIENVAMPLFKISRVDPDEARRRTEALLAFVGLGSVGETAVDELPLAPQYQVAVARGLINEPAVLMVENLDGALHGAELEAFLELLRKAAPACGVAIIATASTGLQAQPGDRVLDIVDGAIARDSEILPETCG